MPLFTAFLAFLFAAGASAETAPMTMPPTMPMDAPWRVAVHDFARQHLKHSAWGIAHSERDYFGSLEIAKADGLTVDEEVLFAAAWLHDMGGFPEFAKPGVDHAVRSAELVADVLSKCGFPMEKVERVKSTILAHTYYNPVAPVGAEEIALHDADTVDFLGMIGIARILSLTERESFLPDLTQGVALLRQFEGDLPKVVVSITGKARAVARVAEMHAALDRLAAESYGGKSL